MSRFRTKNIEVWKKGEPVHLGGGLHVPGEPSFLYEDLVNIQPYSSAEAKKDYGFDVKTTHTMFTEGSQIEIGSTIIKYDGNDFEVKEKIVWNKYTEFLLERIT